jgi:tRNA threonylcarbamoyladenosine biosynthesis protein TsaE
VSRHRIASLIDLRAFAKEIAAEGGSRRLLLLGGPMGAGKTQFAKYFLEAVGSHDTVSPSFAIHHSYETGAGHDVHHFDLFRLENADDLESTGFWDLFAGDGWMIIEWAEKLDEFGLRDSLPRTWDRVHLTFEVADDGVRTITTED